MKPLTRAACWTGSAAAVFGMAALCSAQQRKPSDRRAALAHYRAWFKINPTRLRFAAAPAAQCAAPNPTQLPSPHLDKFITVYVNPLGRRAMLRDSRPKFPVGAVIVKEKYATAASQIPELMTVMRKHPGGYAPDNGDWEYLVLDGKGGRVQAQGRIAACQGCHLQKAATDFVFRTPYFSTRQMEGLKPASRGLPPSY